MKEVKCPQILWRKYLPPKLSPLKILLLSATPMHNKLRGAIGKKKFFFLIGWRLLIFGRILMKFFVLV
jgi:hypothetical protein